MRTLSRTLTKPSVAAGRAAATGGAALTPDEIREERRLARERLVILAACALALLAAHLIADYAFPAIAAAQLEGRP